MLLYIRGEPVMPNQSVELRSGGRAKVSSWCDPKGDFPGSVRIKIGYVKKDVPPWEIYARFKKEKIMPEMKFVVTNQCPGVRVDKLKGRAIFVHGGSFYRVVDAVGDGVTVKTSPRHVLIVNQKIGTLREIPADTHVIPLQPCEDLEIRLYEVPSDQLFHFIK